MRDRQQSARSGLVEEPAYDTGLVKVQAGVVAGGAEQAGRPVRAGHDASLAVTEHEPQLGKRGFGTAHGQDLAAVRVQMPDRPQPDLRANRQPSGCAVASHPPTVRGAL
ncbi:hypothetical protein ACWGI8_07995 [Streptomyces sp. NPDC054841]